MLASHQPPDRVLQTYITKSVLCSSNARVCYIAVLRADDSALSPTFFCRAMTSSCCLTASRIYTLLQTICLDVKPMVLAQLCCFCSFQAKTKKISAAGSCWKRIAVTYVNRTPCHTQLVRHLPSAGATTTTHSQDDLAPVQLNGETHMRVLLS